MSLLSFPITETMSGISLSSYSTVNWTLAWYRKDSHFIPSCDLVLALKHWKRSNKLQTGKIDLKEYWQYYTLTLNHLLNNPRDRDLFCIVEIHSAQKPGHISCYLGNYYSTYNIIYILNVRWNMQDGLWKVPRII